MATPTWENTTEIAPTWENTAPADGRQYDIVPSEEKTLRNQVGSALSGFSDMTTMGLGKYPAAAINAGIDTVTGEPGSFGENYDKWLTEGDDARDYAAQAYPSEFLGGEIAGFAGQMVSPKGVVGALGSVKGFADDAIRGTVDKASKYLPEIPVPMMFQGGETVAQTKAKQSAAQLITESEKLAGMTGAQAQVGQRVAGESGREAAQAATVAKTASAAKTAEAGKGMLTAADVLPRSTTELIGGFLGLKSPMPGGYIAGVQATRQIVKKNAPAAAAFAEKYGKMMLPWFNRGGNAVVANVFIKQQQDPEFREMLAAAKKEAAETGQL